MEEQFEILDPHNAEAFLKSFPAAARAEGQVLYRNGEVTAVRAENPGTDYVALVDDGRLGCEVTLNYHAVHGWQGKCSQDNERNCPHVFAAMRNLIVEHNAAQVRNLSANKVSRGVTTKEAVVETATGASLTRRVTTALGRRLTSQESRFLRAVQEVFKRCQAKNSITSWDFQQMGFRLRAYDWHVIEAWPVMPKNDYEFWLYVARYASKQNLSIPGFMMPITDFSPIEERIANWERQKEIERWTRKLQEAEEDLRENSADLARGETEMRLVISRPGAFLEWKRPARPDFEQLKGQQLARINDEEKTGWLRFTPQAALLWQLLSQRFYYANSGMLRYGDGDAPDIIGRALRSPFLEGHIVDEERRPLRRAPEALKWAVAPAENANADYEFKLIKADGNPVAPIVATFSGKPTLYLTLEGVFEGPPQARGILNIDSENRIPAPAIETARGIEFLRRMKLPVPERLNERLRTIPLDVVIECSLEPIYHGSKTEDCVFHVRATAVDGHEEEWTGAEWEVVEEAEFVRAQSNDSIFVYDRKGASEVPLLLSTLALKSDQWRGGMRLRVSKKFPEIFSEWLKSVPPEVTVKLGGDLASFATADVSGTVKLDVKEAEIDWFDLRVVLDVTDTTLTEQEIKLLLNAKGGYVRLEGKGWRRLKFDLTDDENERLAKLGLNARELTDEPQRLHALQLADDAAKKFLPEQQVEQIHRRAAELKARVAPEVPASITAELRPYQLDGFHFLAYLSSNRFGGILADDMGLGKTLQALAWLVWLRRTGEASGNSGPSLVVCPKSVMDNWWAEAQRFAGTLKVKVWPPSELSVFLRQLSTADIHVINYNQLRTLGESLANTQWLTVILDEGQYIKNPGSQTAQVARSLRAKHRLVLSGTPIENRLMDLWSLMAFAMPGVLGSRAQFGRLYDAKGDPLARKRLSSRVRPFLLRRTKTQVAKDLPDKIEEDLFCEIEGEQQALYRAELKRAQQMLLRIKTQKELAQQHFHFLTSLLRLRQICCHPKLVKPDSSEDGAKTEALMETLEPLVEEGNKILVFSQFVELLNLIKPLLIARNWKHFYLAGETEDRGALVREFQEYEGPAVFLISLKAGGFGLNLTAASYVVLFDPWWNPAVENQAIDRTHRIGQVNKVIAYRLLIKNSIEEKIRELQKKKKNLAEDVLGEERFAQSLTLQDLHFLLGD
jgi:hypothetical protein